MVKQKYISEFNLKWCVTMDFNRNKKMESSSTWSNNSYYITQEINDNKICFRLICEDSLFEYYFSEIYPLEKDAIIKAVSLEEGFRIVERK